MEVEESCPSNGKRNKSDKDISIKSCSVLLEVLGPDFDEVIGRKSGGKRSFYRPSESDFVNDLEEHDVEKEKEELRKEQAAKEEKGKGVTVLKSQTYFNVLNTLSADEIENHYSTCIQLCSQNKVNSKNAFKLQLIDYMKMILNKRSTKTENLSLMSCTLDASAKIYSYRVDKVYSDMLKIISYKEGKSKGNEGSDAEENGNEGEDEDGTNKRKSKGGKEPEVLTLMKRRGSTSETDESAVDKDPMSNPKIKEEWEKVLGSHKSFKRSNIEEEFYFGTMPKEANYFLECPISVNNQLMLDGPLFSQETAERSNAVLKVPKFDGEFIEEDFMTVLPSYDSIENRFHIIDSENRVPSEVPQDVTNVYNPSIDACEYTDLGQDEDFFDINDEDDVELVGQGNDNCTVMEDDNDAGLLPSMAEIGTMELKTLEPLLPQLSLGQESSVSSNLTTLLARSTLDTRVLRNCRFDYWGCPKDWKNKALPNTNGAKKTDPKRKIKGKYVVFSAEEAMRLTKEFVTSSNKEAYKLSRKTIANWKPNFYPPEVEDLRDNLFSFFNCKSIRIIKDRRDQREPHKESTTKESTYSEMKLDDEVMENREAGEELDEDSDRMNVSLFNGSDGGGGNYDDAENLLTHNGEQKLNESLLPIPHRVEKVNVKYAKVQKRIDIKLVKQTLWNIIKPPDSIKENISLKNGGDMSNKEEIHFRAIFSKLKEILPQETSKELSLPIAFMSILHLANEKTLCLLHTKCDEDFTITVDSGTE